LSFTAGSSSVGNGGGSSEVGMSSSLGGESSNSLSENGGILQLEDRAYHV
jgi:hypothetical protein